MCTQELFCRSPERVLSNLSRFHLDKLMTFSGLLVFAIAYAVAVATPGPGVAAVLARALARGFSGMPAFILGFAMGDLALFTIAAAGLAVLAQSYAPLFLAVKYAGALYLLYLAWRLWNSAPEAETITADVPSESGFSLFMTSLTLTLGNPKPIIFFVALLPTIVDLNTLSLLGFAEIAVVIAVIISLTLWTYAFAAARARKLFSSSKALRRINRGTGLVLAGTALLIATR